MKDNTIINKQLVLDLHKKHTYNGQANWNKIVSEYNTITNEYRTKNSIRSVVYRHYRKGNNNKLKKPKNTNKPQHHKKSIKGQEESYKDQSFQYTQYQNGETLYRKTVTLHENESNDHKAILNAFSLDIKTWVITSLKINHWTVESLEKRLFNYQMEIKVRPKTNKDLTKSDVEELFKNMKPLEPMEYMDLSTGKTSSIYFSDNHIGSAVFSPKRFKKTVARIRKYLLEVKPEQVNINFVGDVIHVDNYLKTTAKGTQLEMPMTVYEMIDLADRLIIHAIEQLSITNTKVYWVQGNHSRALEYTVFKGIERYFVNNKHIEFDVSESLRKAYLVYDRLIALNHGDMSKQNMYNWIQFEFAEMWGKAKSWELHTGHLHHLKAVKISTDTIGGLEHTQHGVDIDNTEYEDHLGFRNNYYVTRVYTYNNKDHRRSIEEC